MLRQRLLPIMQKRMRLSRLNRASWRVKVISIDEIKTLAATPSKEVLIAKIMGSLNSPVSSLVRLLNTIVEGGTEIADLVAAKKSEAPAEAAEAEAPAQEEAPAAE